ncbi:hypothetical protein GCM10009632_19140 [Mycolicibacterium alvei]|uniref:Uncharacterized protein n=1 Tax=Mycolicibacterium alvei TaxID=67081 RepID=A0A6N4UMY7_9MYCO|nr:hypothetical protein MALV_01490 [Mycolicibacterium alvei]
MAPSGACASSLGDRCDNAALFVSLGAARISTDVAERSKRCCRSWVRADHEGARMLDNLAIVQLAIVQTELRRLRDH